MPDCEMRGSVNKIIEGAKQALEVARCDHEMIPQPPLKADSKLDRFYCPKCKGTFYEPRLGARS